MLKDVFPLYTDEVEFPRNPGLSRVDVAVLHSFVRYFAPQKIIEVGSGNSTHFIARACNLNKDQKKDINFVAIDPYTRDQSLKELPGLDKLIIEKVQDTDEEVLLNADLIFIDSSHVVRIGGDVNYLILDILPRTKKGCLIHFHDILIPGEYWKEWILDSQYFWSEQYLIQAFLSFNDNFEILWAAHYMQINESERIKAVFPFFDTERQRLSSLWIRRK